NSSLYCLSVPLVVVTFGTNGAPIVPGMAPAPRGAKAALVIRPPLPAKPESGASYLFCRIAKMFLIASESEIRQSVVRLWPQAFNVLGTVSQLLPASGRFRWIGVSGLVWPARRSFMFPNPVAESLWGPT